MALARGIYKARALPDSVQFGEAGAKKTPQILVQFEILDETERPTGEKITWFGFLTDDSMKRTMEGLRYCGWKGNDIRKLDGLGTIPVELDIGKEVYQGKEQTKVNWVNKIGGGGKVTAKAPIEGKGLDALAKRLKLAAEKIPVETGKTAPAGTREPGSDDEIGF